MDRFIARYVMVALSVVGSAILLFSCEREEEPESESRIEMMMTEYSENLSVVMSQNGRRSYHFKTPLLEGYSLAREPYREFPKGVEMTTYKNDSLSSVDAVLTANYAIHYETRDLWEARGNVVVEKSDGKKLYTQQLFWNARTKKIYSNVDSKITQNTDIVYGDGFESDERFEEFVVRNPKGKVTVETAPNRSDTTEKAPEAAPKPDVPADVPVIREGEGVANPATIRNQRKRRDEPRMLGKPVKLERFDRPGRPEADAAGSRRP